MVFALARTHQTSSPQVRGVNAQATAFALAGNEPKQHLVAIT